MKTYQISVNQVTAKQKELEVAKLFVNSSAKINKLQTFYYNRFKPLSVRVTEVETINLEDDQHKQFITELNGANMSSNAHYRISLEILPESVEKKIEKVERVKRELTEATKSLQASMNNYVNYAVYVSHSKDSIEVRGYLKALKLQEPTKD